MMLYFVAEESSIMPGLLIRNSKEKEFKTGIKILDYQHDLLFELFEKLKTPPSDESEFYAMLIDISNYLNTHFKTEEDFMLYINYPRFERHKTAHDDFLVKYKKIIEKSILNVDFVSLNADVKQFLSEWYEYHYNTYGTDKENDLNLMDYIIANKGKKH